jgi:predicted ribosomally synthesized peptide with SipW-like signal peptide
MKRSILLSMLVIGAVAAMITAVTTATFTDQVVSEANEVQAGIIQISVDGDSCSRSTGATDTDNNADGDGTCKTVAGGFTATKLLPGESDEYTFKVENVGNRTGDLTVSIGTPTYTPAACGASNWDISIDDSTHTIAAGGSVNVKVTAELVSTAGNACQNASVEFDVVFDFAQA